MELVSNAIIPPEYLNSVTTFLSLLEPASTVLILGAGATELLSKFKTNGFNVVCIEENADLVKKWKQEGIEMIEGTVKNLASLKVPKNLQGIWGGAAFEHMPEDQLEHNLELIHLMLPEEGALFLSLPLGAGEVTTSAGTTHFYSEAELRQILVEKHFDVKLIEASTSATLTSVATKTAKVH
ncbi:hypothetical protein [Bdellovibrio sp. KM01]|uniref:hypothetical protein n=1 Tax=Bdellovibrio sp. KM01 TaxID=2748865 RepID=UPI0015E92209|nr:hypothetical protein [Bdellovibrio sp. KM01]QLY26688.1 hypothetical protein HW988_06675 [Bdellovibrio sp. KM01]